MAALQTIRIMLVDDHRMIHEGVAKILHDVSDLSLVAQAQNGEEAVKLCDQVQPDVILMDVVMPIMDGTEATRQIHEKHPLIKILVLSSFQDEESVRLMLNNGAIGYILKTSLSHDLVDTVRTVFRGKVVLSPEVADTLLQSPAGRNDFALSARELEVLSLIGHGLNNYEIADQLTISRSTVKFHVTNILKKMKVDTRAEAIVIATQHDLL